MNIFKTLLLVLTFFTCVTTHAESTSTTDATEKAAVEDATAIKADTKVNEESDVVDADTKKLLPTKDEPAEAVEKPADNEESDEDDDDEEPDADDC